MSHSLYLVVGLGKTGLSIARYLTRNNKNFIAFDTRNQTPALAEFNQEFPHIPVYLKKLPQKILDQLTDIITSPGVTLDTPLLQQAMRKDIAIYGDIECLAREIKAPIIAITGTNGKSTVTTLVGEMAKAAGFLVAVGGNIGTPVLDLLNDGHTYDLWVLELSSFQLELTFSLAPKIATILNITPDHLDRHHTFAQYIQAKQRIYAQAKVALFNREDKYTAPILSYDHKKISFGRDKPSLENWGLITQDNKTWLAKGSTCLLAVDSLVIKGVHNWLNALAACALAETAGIELDVIVRTLKNFRGLPHRCQWIRTLNGVQWINDSKGTNVGATVSAITGIGSSILGKIVLIAGGQGKGADFQELALPVAKYGRALVLIGEDADKMAAVLSKVVPTSHASSLEQAVKLAQTKAQPNDVVLLSPACASLDMFCDFNHRGDVFAAFVMGL